MRVSLARRVFGELGVVFGGIALFLGLFTSPADAVPFNLNVAKIGAGSGTVTSVPAGINCGTDCTESYEQGTSVTLTGTPSSGYYLAGWSGGGCSGTDTCTVQVNSETTVTAQFELQTPKKVALKASERLIGEGDRVTLTAKVSPCGNHAGEIVNLKSGGKTRSKHTNSTCKAKWRMPLQKTTRFRANSPQQDADHLAGVSRRVKVRVILEPEPVGGGGGGGGAGGGGGGGGGGCDPSYPDFCIPPPPPDRDCDDVSGNNFTVKGSDPHGFDSDGDGVGCET